MVFSYPHAVEIVGLLKRISGGPYFYRVHFRK